MRRRAASHWPPADVRTTTSFYESGYALYAHAPGASRERARQAEYARWIAAGHRRGPRRVLDIGCGNGSLLRALRDLWPDAELCGCDPSPESIAQARWPECGCGGATLDDVPPDVVTDLAVTINVIEHTPDPLRFLERIRGRMTRGGRLVVVCPDGGQPGVELLFADHSSRSRLAHLEWLVERAGFDVMAASPSPPTLGQFQMVDRPCVSMRSRRPCRARDSIRSAAPPISNTGGHWTRTLFARLKAASDLLRRRRGGGTAACLRAARLGLVPHALWTEMRAGTFGDLPIVALDRVTTIRHGAARCSSGRPAAGRRAPRATVSRAWLHRYDLVDVERADGAIRTFAMASIERGQAQGTVARMGRAHPPRRVCRRAGRTSHPARSPISASGSIA